MRNQIVSLNLAKILRDKKFNGSASTYFAFHENSFDDKVGYIADSVNQKYLDTQHKGDLLAPALSEVQRWLRDEHNLFLSVTCNTKGWFWELSDCKGKCITYNDTSGTNRYNQWTYYEDALEAGLLKTVLNHLK